MVVGVSASAARISALLVMDLEPGSRTTALTADLAVGASQLSCSCTSASMG